MSLQLRLVERASRLVPVLSTLALASSAQTFVITDVASLEQTVASAPDGATIELHTDAELVGSLAWGGKSLTICAGEGFRPTLRGELQRAAIKLHEDALGTSATLEGLRLSGGPGISGDRPAAVRLEGQSSSGLPITLEMTDCELLTGFEAHGAHQQQFQIEMDRCSLNAGAYLVGNGYTGGSLSMRDSQVDGELRVDARDVSTFTASVRRTRVDGSVLFLGAGAGTVIGLVESSLLVSDGSRVVGLVIEGEPNQMNAQIVNATISGFEVGATATDGAAAFTNVVFHRNGRDLGPGIRASQVSYSLLQGEAYAGQNGNVQARAILDANYALVGAGVDAGLSSALALGPRDLYGQDRIMDSDGDGLANVSMGAVESSSCAPAILARMERREGLPANPGVLAPVDRSRPVVGQDWRLRVDHTDFAEGCFMNLLGVSLGEANMALGEAGTLLIDPSRLVSVDPFSPDGDLRVEIPAECESIGAKFHVQVLSLSIDGSVHFSNALDAIAGLQ